MRQLSDEITRKFTDSIDLDEWEIDTDDGWKPLISINKTIPYPAWRLETKTGLWFEGADDHIVILENGDQCFIKDLIPNQSIIVTKNGTDLVTSLQNLHKEEEMYDPEVLSESHLYWSNDILSHNTITVCAFLLYQAIFNNDYFIAILANNASKSREILGRLKMMYELLPWWLKPGVVEWNKGSVEFSNGSKIFAGPTTNSSIRGFSVNLVYLDEFAFVQNDVEFFTSTYPVIASGTQTKIIITSTPNGMNLFYKIYTDAVNQKNEFKAIKYLWYRHPNRDDAWKRETIRNTSEKQFRQEHDCEFLGSSNTLISGECLERLVFKDPIYSDDYSHLYEKPQPDHIYVCFVDVSEGAGRDYSVVNVIDITDKPYRQVYVYRRNDLSPWLLTPIVMDIAMKYNQAYIQVENNSVGKIVADTLFFEYDYENTISSKLFKGEEKFAEFTTHGLGVRMDRKSKVMGCSALKTLLEENMLIIPDWTTIQELSWFVKTKTSYEAEKGKTDDIAMTLVHFGWLSIQTFFENLSKQGIYDLMRDLTEKNEDQRVTAFGFFSDGTEDDECNL